MEHWALLNWSTSLDLNHKIETNVYEIKLRWYLEHLEEQLGKPLGNPMGTWSEQGENKGVCHTMILPFTLKSIVRQKKNYGNPNISTCKNTIFKKSSKRNQNPSNYNSINWSQVSTQAKISSFKNPHIKIDLLPRGQNPVSLLYLSQYPCLQQQTFPLCNFLVYIEGKILIWERSWTYQLDKSMWGQKTQIPMLGASYLSFIAYEYIKLSMWNRENWSRSYVTKALS